MLLSLLSQLLLLWLALTLDMSTPGMADRLVLSSSSEEASSDCDEPAPPPHRPRQPRSRRTTREKERLEDELSQWELAALGLTGAGMQLVSAIQSVQVESSLPRKLVWSS